MSDEGTADVAPDTGSAPEPAADTRATPMHTDAQVGYVHAEDDDEGNPRAKSHDENDPEGNPGGETAKQRADRIKAKILGRDFEGTPDELVRMLENFEDEITVNGQPRKAKYNDLVRGYQLSEGAFAKMQEAAELRKKFESERARGKEDPGWYMREVLGQDPRKWANDYLYSEVQERQRLEELMQSNPAKAVQELQQIERQRVQREAEAERRQAQQQAEQEQRQKAIEEINKQIPEALKSVGLPANDTTKAIMVRIGQRYAQVGNPLPFDHLAELTRDAYMGEIRSVLDSFEGERLLEFLGEDRRKVLRDLELKAVKGKERAAKKAETRQAPPQKPNGKRLTEREWLEQFG